MNYTHVIWDWNGTLLDDAEWNRMTINTMLQKRNLPTLPSLDSYRAVFGFPVIDYYRRVGFDFEKEPFETLATEYIDLYHSQPLPLFPEAKAVLESIHHHGICQIILSASEQGNLNKQVEVAGVGQYLDAVLGISNIYATSKVEIGQAYIAQAIPKKAVLIGDTTHDKEVADALGIDCILIANGHQPKSVLAASGAMMKNNLREVEVFLCESRQCHS